MQCLESARIQHRPAPLNSTQCLVHARNFQLPLVQLDPAPACIIALKMPAEELKPGSDPHHLLEQLYMRNILSECAGCQ